MQRPRNVQGIAEWRLCVGCGACAYICPERKVKLVDFLEEGYRPVLPDGADCGSCTECLKVCPGFENDRRAINNRAGAMAEVTEYCGPVLEIWEGHAVDEEVRFRGASGGILTAVALYCLERENMQGTLHIGMDPRDPMRNCTKFSRTRAELLAQAGSRYAPAAACDSLHAIESAEGKCVFIGQPSEVTALRKAAELRPKLKERVGVALSFFCAGSPSRQGTLELLKSRGIDPGEVSTLKYRGQGWPGMFAVTLDGKKGPSLEMTYQESWGFIQAYRPFSTHLFPDGTGEDADISCGDPWYRKVKKGEPGSSLVLVRTEEGRRLIRGAMAAGYISLTPAESSKLLESQKNLIAKRGAIGGRVATLRLLGLPAPRLRGFALGRNWSRLPFGQKLRSTVGTVRRVLARKYYRRLRLDAVED